MLPAIRNSAADRCQTHCLLASSSYWQGCTRKEFIAQPQKILKRSVFQQHHASDIGALVYKHSRRYFYILTYIMVSVTMIGVVVTSSLLFSGYTSLIPEYDDPVTYRFAYVALVFGVVLYLLALVLVRSTICYMYYNELTRHFHGVHYNWRMARKNIVFKPGDVRLTGDNAGTLQLLRGGYIIDNKPYHISSLDFTSPFYYNLMLGFIDP